MALVKIPTTANPWSININNVTYGPYSAGEEVEVPNVVAEFIAAITPVKQADVDAFPLMRNYNVTFADYVDEEIITEFAEEWMADDVLFAPYLALTIKDNIGFAGTPGSTIRYPMSLDAHYNEGDSYHSYFFHVGPSYMQFWAAFREFPNNKGHLEFVEWAFERPWES